MIDLERLIDRYGELNFRAKRLDDEKKALNAEIKRAFLENGATELAGKEYKAYVQERVSETLNEDKVIAILKAHHLDYGIRTKEYIDEEELENAIYNGLIPKNVLKDIAECKVIKKTNALIVKEIK